MLCYGQPCSGTVHRLVEEEGCLEKLYHLVIIYASTKTRMGGCIQRFVDGSCLVGRILARQCSLIVASAAKKKAILGSCRGYNRDTIMETIVKCLDVLLIKLSNIYISLDEVFGRVCINIFSFQRIL